MSREFIREVRGLTRELTEELMDSQTLSNRISSPFIPDRRKVIEIVNDLRKILFPVQFGGEEITNCTLDYFLGSMLIKVEEKLHKQIGIALMREEQEPALSVTQAVADRAAELSVHFMQRIPYILDMLKLDVAAFYEGDPAAQSKDEIILSYPGLFAIMVYRIAHELQISGVPVIPRMMTEYAHNLTGVDINPGAKIGKYFFIDHATGVVIGETCSISDHVKLYQGVTLGALSTRGGQDLRGKKRHPTIEEDVTIYANATILGGDTVIGKGAVIGGSCFITDSIPPYARVQTVSKIQFN